MAQFKHIMKFIGTLLASSLSIGLIVWLIWYAHESSSTGNTLRDLALFFITILLYIITCSLPIIYAVYTFDFNPRWRTIFSWLASILLSSLLAGIPVQHYWPNVLEPVGVSPAIQGITYLLGYGMFVLIIIYTAIIAISCLVVSDWLLVLLLKLLWIKTR